MLNRKFGKLQFEKSLVMFVVPTMYIHNTRVTPFTSHETKNHKY